MSTPAPTATLLSQPETQRLIVQGLIQLVATLVGGAISAFVAVAVATKSSQTALENQHRQSEDARRLEAERNARLDGAIRRQVLALLRSVGPYVRTARRFGILRSERWKPFLDRLRSRLIEPDAALAFTDDQSFSIYRAVDSCELALRVHIDNEAVWDREDKSAEGATVDQSRQQSRSKVLQGTYKTACDDLRATWNVLGDALEVQAFDDVERYLQVEAESFAPFESAEA